MFFDLMHVEWRYEHEGYQLESGWYLPDFWLPEIKSFVEIKPTFNCEYDSEQVRWNHAINLCRDLAMHTKYRTYLFSGDFGFWLPNWEYVCETASAFFPEGGEDFGYLPCVCMECGKFGIEFNGRSARICLHNGPAFDKGYNAADPRIVEAVAAAQNHRFDYQGARR
jgi:hypothetical protein